MSIDIEAVKQMSLDDIIPAIQDSPYSIMIELNLSPRLIAKFYPTASPIQQHCPVIIRLYDGIDTYSAFGSDVKIVLIAMFEKHPEWMETIFGTRQAND